MSNATPEEAASAAREEKHELGERYGVVGIDSGGMPTLFVGRDQVIKLVKALHKDGYLQCLDVTAVDYLYFGRRTGAEGDLLIRPRVLPGDLEPERFEVVYHLLNHRDRARVRIRVQVPESDPVAPSVFDLHPGTEAAEREVFDMYGIAFTGHPDLTRILMPEDWVGHPLRKDYAIGRIPVQFKAAPSSR